MNNLCIFKGSIETCFILLCSIWKRIIYILYSIFTCIFWTRIINKWTSEHVWPKEVTWCIWKFHRLPKTRGFGRYLIFVSRKAIHVVAQQMGGVGCRLWEESQWRGEVYRCVVEGYHVFYLNFFHIININLNFYRFHCYYTLYSVADSVNKADKSHRTPHNSGLVCLNDS